MVGADPAQLLLGRVGADAAEEDTHFGLPALEVGTQDGRRLLVDELRRPERLRASSDAQLSFADRPKVPNPWRHAARREEVAIAFVGQEVDRRRPPLAALAAAHAQLPGSPDADPGPSEQRDDWIEDVLGEPGGTDIPGLRFAGGHASNGIRGVSRGVRPEVRPVRPMVLRADPPDGPRSNGSSSPSTGSPAS